MQKNMYLVFGLFITGLVAAASIQAQIPRLINYQGVLTDDQGNAINGDRSIQFSIYEEEKEGSPVWTEVQTITIVDGYFSVLLGSVTPVPLDVFDGSDAYLALKVGSDNEMTPRKRLVSVGYAFYAADADKLDGRGSAQYVRTVDGVVPANGNINLVPGDNITITHPEGNKIEISAAGGGSSGDNLGDHSATRNISLNGNWLSGDGEAEGVFITDAGKVGIGFSAPNLRLEAAGSVLAKNGYVRAEGVNDRSGELGRWYGAFGHCSGSGYFGYLGSSDYGAYGQATSSIFGYLGGSSYGAYGQAAPGIYGYLGGSSYGAYGQYSSSVFGVLGHELYGVYGSHGSNIRGHIGSSMAGAYGEAEKAAGILGWYTPYYVGYLNVGVYGSHQDGGFGYLGSETHAGGFVGDVRVNGSLSKFSGSFKIDHPLDPANKYLQHSFVESPDMMNVYNGNVILNANGEATVELPDYFEALNRDFRYQLTPIGAPGPGLYISRKIADNSFAIAGGSPGLEVSWQVTGIRRDAWAEAHRIEVEVDKGTVERGTYLHPEELGLPKSSGESWPMYQALENSKREIEKDQPTRRAGDTGGSDTRGAGR